MCLSADSVMAPLYDVHAEGCMPHGKTTVDMRLQLYAVNCSVARGCRALYCSHIGVTETMALPGLL